MRKPLLLHPVILLIFVFTSLAAWSQNGRLIDHQLVHQESIAGFEAEMIDPADLGKVRQSVQHPIVPTTEFNPEDYVRCASVQHDEWLRQTFPELPTKDQFEQWMAQELEKAEASNERPAPYQIPYIFHVVHNTGEAVGSGRNLSAAQVYQQIAQLNADFKRTNSDAGNTPAQFLGVAGSIDITFVPALVDTNGNTLPEPGINRIDGEATFGVTNWEGPDGSNNATTVLVAGSVWDPNLYMNLFSVELMGSLLGYAQLPAGPNNPPGLPGGGSANTDAVVLTTSSVGSLASPGSDPFYGFGRTATHEVGHWLGLRHIWGDGDCTFDDFCNDTPTQAASSSVAPPCTFPAGSTCPPADPDMFMNYMDYSTDQCMNLFTADQVGRMDIVINNSVRRASLTASTVGGSGGGACLLWLGPTPTEGYTVFNSTFGGAPCDDGTGCSTNTYTGWEVWAAEAYAMANVVAGASYTFDICTGANAGSWVPDFTIIAPSGAVDASGAGDGDGCSITWTASESGEYLIVINEAGFCGGGSNIETDNGNPAITCNGSPGPACAPCLSTAGTLAEDDSIVVCTGQFATVMTNGDQDVTDGDYRWQFIPGVDGTGGTDDTLTIFSNEPDFFSYTFDADLNGILSSNGYPPYSGTWCVVGIATNSATQECDRTPTSRKINFVDSTNNPICEPLVCEAGSLASTTTMMLCPGDTVTVETNGDETIPMGGYYGFRFTPGMDGTGGTGGTVSIIETGPSYTFDDDLNGLLSGNAFPRLRGTWIVMGEAYTAADELCDTTLETKTIIFLDSTNLDELLIVVESCNPDDTGTVVQVFTNEHGCDSVVTTVTGLLPSDMVTINEESCNPGDTGTVVQVLENIFGCDSVITTITALLPSDMVTINEESCNPADTGTVVQVLENEFGCDSAITTITALLPSDMVTINEESCNPADTGTVVQVLENEFGCDSVITTITALLPSDMVTINEESCNPADTGTVVQVLENEFGCDSAITTITTLLPSDMVTINEESCNPADTGTVVQVLENEFGCDSAITTITTLLPSDMVTINDASCNPADTGTDVQVLENIFGCDSVITTVTILLTGDMVTINETSCNPADTGTVIQNLTNSNGCDSIVTTVTTLLPTATGTTSYNGCEGDGYSIIVNGTLYDESNPTGMETFAGGAANGCDSIVTVDLFFDECACPPDLIDIDLTTCNENEAGVVIDSLINASGCDSVITTTTTLLPSDAVTLMNGSCNPADTGSTVQNLTNQFGCDSIVTTVTTLLDSDDVTVFAESCNPADTGTVVQTLTNQDGCDSVVTTETSLVESYNITIDASSCNPADTGTVVDMLTSSTGCDSTVTTVTALLDSYDITISETSCEPADTGTVVTMLISSDGCDSIVTTVTTLLPSYALTLNESSCNPGDTGTVVNVLTAENGCDSVVTMITTLLESYNIEIDETSCNPADTGTTVQILTAANGCDSIITTTTNFIPGDDPVSPIDVPGLPYVDMQSTESCYSDQGGQASVDVWYRFSTSANADSVIVTTCSGSSNFNTFISLLQGAAVLASNDDDISCTFSGDRGDESTLSTIREDIDPSTTYIVRVEGSAAVDAGVFELTITEIALQAGGIPNDSCEIAIEVFCGDSIAGSTDGATVAPDLDDCGALIGGSPAVWYYFEGTGDDVTFSTCDAATFDTKIGVYSGSCDALVCEDGNDDADDCSSFTSELTITTDPGQDYYIVVTGFDPDEFGEFGLQVTCVTPPPAPMNDTCGGAMSIACDDDFIQLSNGATDADAPQGCSSSGAGVWYSFTGDGQNWTITATPLGGWDNEIHVYTGGCGALSCITSADVGFTDDPEEVSLNTVMGTDYLVYVGGWGTGITEIGDLNIAVSCAPSIAAPANDTCQGAVAVMCGTDILVSGEGVTDADAPQECSSSGAGVWYSFTGDGQLWEITATPIGWDNEVHVYSGDCDDLTCEGVSDIGFDDDPETVSVETAPGEEYLVYVGGWGTGITSIDSFQLEITCSMLDTCSAGTLTSTDSIAICPDSTVTLTSLGDSIIPDGGQYGIYFIPGPDGAGALDDEFVLLDTPTPFTFDQSLNGILPDNFLEDFSGTWYVHGAVYRDPGNPFFTICDLTDDFLTVTFLELGEGDCPLPPPVPENDTCGGAIEITCGSVTPGSTVDATLDNTEDFCGTSVGAPGIWYTFTGIGEDVTFSTCDDADFDTKIIVYSGSCDALICEAGNDDGLGCGLTSELTVSTALGVTYFIYVNGFGGQTGNFNLTVTCPPPTVCPEPSGIMVDNITETSADISWTPGGSEMLWDIEIVNLTLGESFTGVPTASGLMAPSYMAMGLDPGTDYEVWVRADCGPGAGDTSVWIGPVPFTTLPPPAPINDLCDGAIEVTCGSTTAGSTLQATDTDTPAGFCGTTPSAPGIWYLFNGNGDDVTFSTCDDADFDTKINVYTGSCGALVCEDGNDDGIGCSGFTSELTVSTVPGTTYYIYVNGFGSEVGDFNLTLSCVTPPPAPENDTCNGAIEVTCGSVTSGSTEFATADDAPADCGTSLSPAPGVWYYFAGTDQDVTFSTCGTADYDTKIAVFSGSCDALTCVDGNDDGSGCAGFTSELEVRTYIGTDYYIYITGFGSQVGNFDLSVTCLDTCEAIAITVDSIADASCAGPGVINITVDSGVGPFDFLWSNGSTDEDITVTEGGDYTVTITGADGCVLVAGPFTLDEEPAPSEVVPPVVVSPGCSLMGVGSIDVTIGGGTPPYEFVWSSGDSTEDLTGLAAGTYTLTVTDAVGCTYTSQDFVLTDGTTLIELAPAVITNVDCNGNATGAIDVTIGGGTPPYIYRWSNDLHTEDVDGLEAGEYYVYVEDATGCSLLAGPYIVTEPDELTISGGAVSNVSCNGEADGSVTGLVVSGGTEPYNYLWNDGTTTLDNTALTAGVHQVTVTDANGCVVLSEIFNITQPAAISVPSVVITDADCNGASTGAIDITVAGGTPPYSFDWSNGATTEDLMDVPAGEYTGTITDANGCVLVSPVLTVGEPSLITVANTIVEDASCFGGDDGSINITVSGGVPPYTYIWSNDGETTQDINGLAAGDYTVDITDANDCTVTSSPITIGEPDELTVSFLEISDVTCAGGNDGSIDVEISGGTPPYMYQWSNGETTQDIDGLTAGDYTGIITDANGCVLESPPLTVGEPEPLEITSVDVIDNLCNGDADGSIDIEVAGGTPPYTYSWSNGETTQDIENLAAGEYIGTITDANGCVLVSPAVEVDEPFIVFQAAGPDVVNVSCNGETDGSIDITLEGGTLPYSILWSNGLTDEDQADLAPGDYSFTVTDFNGCVYEFGPITVGEPDILEIPFVDIKDAECNGEPTGIIDIEVAGGTPPYSFDWSNGTPGEDLIGVTAGEYSVVVTDSRGCTVDSGPLTVGEPSTSLVVFAEVTNATAPGANDGSIDLDVQGGGEPYTYSWNTGDVTQDLDNIAGGDYCVTIIDANGCELEYCVEVGIGTPVIDLLQISAIDLFPNPARNIAQLKVSFSQPSDMQVQLVDVLGRIMSETLVLDAVEENVIFDVAEFSAGTYFVKVSVDGQSITLPLIVQH